MRDAQVTVAALVAVLAAARIASPEERAPALLPAPAAISPREVAAHVDEVVMVETRIGETSASAGRVYLVPDDPEVQNFRIVFVPPLTGETSTEIADYYRGRQVRAIGRVQEFNGKLEIFITDSGRLQTVEPRTAAHAAEAARRERAAEEPEPRAAIAPAAGPPPAREPAHEAPSARAPEPPPAVVAPAPAAPVTAPVPAAPAAAPAPAARVVAPASAAAVVAGAASAESPTADTSGGEPPERAPAVVESAAASESERVGTAQAGVVSAPAPSAVPAPYLTPAGDARCAAARAEWRDL
ncbi:MAG TPA: hypothetical protein VEI94_07180, partial [Candidatus Bathyarchaeia archaeon]|nr:hypothetical protein [Candidatus Bathyarchaeia archaeon]